MRECKNHLVNSLLGATLCVASILAIHSQSALAAPLQFFGEDRGVFDNAGSPTGTGHPNATAADISFLANLVGVGTETFEGFSVGDTTPLALSFPGAGAATLEGQGRVDDDPDFGQNAISGSNWWRTGQDNDFVVEFANPVAAFGFYGIDIGDGGAQLTLSLSNGSVVDIDIPHTLEAGGASSGQNGSVIYFGYIDTENPWTRAEFTNAGGSLEDFGFDDMTIGSVDQILPPGVPEPATFALVGAGLLIASFRRRRSYLLPT